LCSAGETSKTHVAWGDLPIPHVTCKSRMPLGNRQVRQFARLQRLGVTFLRQYFMF
jgi:hypothetical protein